MTYGLRLPSDKHRKLIFPRKCLYHMSTTPLCENDTNPGSTFL